MKTAQTIFQEGSHRWVAITRDPERPEYLIDTNEYVVIDGDDALVCDPGGQETFPAVFATLSNVCNPNSVRSLFSSHQDPDIISSLPLWLEFNPAIRCYVSWLWTSFIPHFGGTRESFIPIPDEGMNIELGTVVLKAVAAHYLHSSGNFHLYDPKARILFSGDVGAAIMPPDAPIFVSDFDHHIKQAEGFHRRWMGSKEAKREWCERVSALQVDMLCPQHGAIYRGNDVARFVHWFDELEVGVLRR